MKSSVGEAAIPMSIDISVIIVACNNLADLERCLPSLELSCGGNVEIIVVDNASEDGTPEWVSENFPAIRLLRNQGNPGFGGGNNQGARLARGEYLAFLNPDTTVEAGWLEALVAVLRRDPQIGLATSRIMLMQNPERINTCGNDIHLSGITMCRGYGRPAGAYSAPADVAAVSGAAFAMQRALYEQLCGFDESFFMYMEDTDLSIRARLSGYRNVYVPGSVVYHRYTLRLGPRKTFYQERNRYLMLLKSLGWTTLLLLAPVFLLAEVMTWGFVLLREPKHWRNKVHAYGWVCLHWAEIRAERSTVQSRRVLSDPEVLTSFQTKIDFEQLNMNWAGRAARSVFNPLFGLYGFFVKKAI